ncbi:hypothetical protein GJ689_10470 [Rhodoplanes serenus]|uniref:Uncharacterized protein n=1 Tax=Rhodoplanes serenus TaxID=200615 RepID=A0A9X4XK13_9BRAD|nr:hypothetical protein [Rhodoplanes serenus]MTW16628.1 hypothetical protein [Rhodoplanes serenus]
MLGYAHIPVPALEVSPPDIARDLVALAKRMNTEMPAAFTARSTSCPSNANGL